MSLTTGRGPLSEDPAGWLSAPLPADLLYVEPFRRRVRGVLRGQDVLDSERVLLVHCRGCPPSYAFPAEDVRRVATEPEPSVPGYVRVQWEMVEQWYEEGERVFGHPRNPYHRVDCIATTRRLRVEVAGVLLVDTDDSVGVYETALEPRLYVRRQHVRPGLLQRSETTTYCPYKGTASYWSAVIGESVVPDIAWSYDAPLPECLPIAGLLSFDEARAMVVAQLPAPAQTPA